MSLGDELDRIARSEEDDLDLLYRRRDRDAERHPIEYLHSPAIGEFAVGRLVPELEADNRVLRDTVESLTLDLDRAHVLIDTLQGNIAALAMDNGPEF